MESGDVDKRKLEEDEEDVNEESPKKKIFSFVNFRKLECDLLI